MAGENLFCNCMPCVKKESLVQSSNDLNCITGKVLKSLDRRVETYLNVFHKDQKDGQRYLSVELEVTVCIPFCLFVKTVNMSHE